MVIGPATPDDIPALARLHVKGWRAAYNGLADQAFLDALTVEGKEEEWRRWMQDGQAHTLLARDGDGRAAGFISFGKLRTPPPGSSPIRPAYSAEIYALYIDPARWRQGIGRTLMTAAATALKDMKHRSVCLWVLDGNKNACAFYKAMGGQRCGRIQVDIGGKTLLEAAFGWRDTAILTEKA